MKTEFKNWMINMERKSKNTAYKYVLSIDKISTHYYQQTGNYIDVYKETNVTLIKVRHHIFIKKVKS